MTPSQPNSLIYILERLFVVVGLLLMLGALKGIFTDLSQVRGGIGYSTEGNLRFQIFGSSIYLIASAVILAKFGRFQWLCLRNKSFILLIALVVISVLWSTNPTLSLRRAMELVGTTIFAIYLALRFRPEELLVLLAWAFGLAAIMTLVLALVFPSYGVYLGPKHQDLWRGVFAHKNVMGRMMTLGAIVFLLVALTRRQSRWVAWSGVILCAGLVVMSGSRTALVALATLIILLWPLRQLGRTQVSLALRFALVGIFLLSGVFFLLQSYEEGLTLLGRDTTLSGRTKIWELAYEFGSQRPWLGYGYRVFWTEENAGYLYHILAWERGISHAHNGFLDLWLDLGFVGVGVFLMTLITCTRRVMSRLMSSRDALGLWYPLFLAYMMLISLTETGILEGSSITWVLYTTTLFHLCLSQPEVRLLDETASRDVSGVRI